METEPKLETDEQKEKPRLETPDLEFDYDRRNYAVLRKHQAESSDHDVRVLKEWKYQFYVAEPDNEVLEMAFIKYENLWP